MVDDLGLLVGEDFVVCGVSLFDDDLFFYRSWVPVSYERGGVVVQDYLPVGVFSYGRELYESVVSGRGDSS